MHYRFIEDCDVETYQAMLARGWRRFGQVFFRPICAACHECRSLRVDVEAFAPNRSMRRTLQQNRDLEIILQPPSLTGAHLGLYERYHADMAVRRGWREKDESPLDYYMTFIEGHQDFGRELLFLLGDRLVCVALVDVLPRAISAVYCFYDPQLRSRSLGVQSVLTEIELARERSLPYVYLGYWVADNVSMRYKARYRPHELLEGRPGFEEEPKWRRGASRGGRGPAIPRSDADTSAR